ncbi:RNA polymerase sigma factor [Steroidobacter sp.]|uniref:RNA polymerase sigma factor n=1 Tax=Steroidobacter sp. TaxID=1978227 RepID=UPI001A4D95F8|nr:sigma-70 family RNA polymerase sigma factor [Steroidobacter sp.]MBL8267510.1 sigma-70 family RNA polymerase sigma factor [Steroidobacter sp.]
MYSLSNSSQDPPGEDALARAYEQYRQELRRFFERNARDRQTVDDLMQAMYLRLVRRAIGEQVQDPQRYLFRVAWNLLHTTNRRQQEERTRTVSCHTAEFDAHADRGNALWLEDNASTALFQEEMNRALRELPVACQVAMLRQYRDNRTYKEIAEELGVTPHAVKKYIVRALNHFRMHFNEMRRPEDTEAEAR